MTIMADYNYNPDVIRSQIKTLKIIELMVKNMYNVIEKDIIPHINLKFRNLIKLCKDKRLKTIKSNADKKNFQTDNLTELKNIYKERYNVLSIDYIKLINNIIQKQTTLVSLFAFLYQHKSTNMTHDIVKQIYELKNQQIIDFLTNKDDIFNSINNLEDRILNTNIFYLIVDSYSQMVKLTKIIAYKEQEQKEQEQKKQEQKELEQKVLEQNVQK